MVEIGREVPSQAAWWKQVLGLEICLEGDFFRGFSAVHCASGAI